jgi:hypothetical protein
MLESARFNIPACRTAVDVQAGESAMHGDRNATSVTLLVDAGKDARADDVDTLTRGLRTEIQEFGVEAVTLQTTAAVPSGTKSVEAVTLGALAVTVLPPMLPRLIEFLQAWSLRRKDRTVKIKASVGDRSVDIEYPEGASEPVVRELIQKMTDTLSAPPANPRLQ